MVIAIVLFISILLRFLIGQFGYSGHGKPPMFGDFEAQRHWMEVTLNLDVGDWYRHTKENDLQYWGLDYPPLTAYVSYGFGIIAHFAHPQLVEWMASRGHESVIGKLFMRITVIVSDLIVFIPAIVQSFSSLGHLNLLLIPAYQIMTLLLLINAPALLLIDHGHFQYNGVCLGFALIGSCFVVFDYDILGSIFFCLSLNFKQMSLYYAPVFFLALLRKCFIQPQFWGKLSKFFSIGCTVIIVFGILWAPFCLFPGETETCMSSVLHVISRQFPFSRGIFEDKVSNIWFSLSVLIDFRQYLSKEELIQLSLGLTLLLLSPVMAFLLLYPVNFQSMTKSLIVSALAFFLGSFQVHEKSILLAAVPSLLLLETEVLFCWWFQIASCFSMFPLLVRDGLRLPYWCCVTLFGIFLAIHKFIFESIRPPNSEVSVKAYSWFTLDSLFSFIVVVSMVGMVVLHCLEMWMPPPARYPDLYPVLFALSSTCMFCAAYIYVSIKLWYSSELKQSMMTTVSEISNDRKNK